MTKNVGQSTKNIGRMGAAELFASSVMIDLLKIFFLHTSEEFYQRELSRLSGDSLYLVQRELSRLERSGLVRKERRGNRVYYSAQEENPAFLDLKKFFIKTVALGDKLSHALAPLLPEINLAFIYGSVATGEDRPGSDVDIMVIGEVSLKELSKILGPLSRELGREFNPSAYAISEFKKRIKEGNAFIWSVINSPKIWLVGDEDGLAGLAG
ncbi:MAG: ArsR family transcriptional regulator [Actinobacteria bacterium]|nr:ArsR family transcriptional regulator [Actinomycetota bacterium]